MTNLDKLIIPNEKQAGLGGMEDIITGVCRAPLYLGKHIVLP